MTKSKEGKILCSKEDVMQSWVEYFSELDHNKDPVEASTLNEVKQALTNL